jgi:hypothetical protein
MQNTVESFKQNGYVHLKDFLDLDNCKELNKHIKDLVAQGKTTKDPQCPNQKLYMVQLLLINS